MWCSLNCSISPCLLHRNIELWRPPWTSWIFKHKMIFKSKLCQVFLAVEFWCAISPVTHTTIIQLVQINLDFVQGQVGLLLKATHTRKIIIYRNVYPPRLKTSLCWEWKDISGGILCQVCVDQYQKRLITIQSARDPMQFRGFFFIGGNLLPATT